MNVSLRRLVGTETRLFLREPVSLIFAFAFPVLTVLIISGSFEEDDPAFGGVAPSDYYMAAYVGVVLAAVGLIMLPVHLASYRERGVLRRFDASPFPPWALPAAWLVVASVIATAAIVVLLGTVGATFGLPAPDHLIATVLTTMLSAFTFVNIGILLGLLLPTARGAQAVGTALFFPSFLLGGAGPPPSVMPSVMRRVADVFPTTHVVRALQRSWLSIGGPGTSHLVVLSAVSTTAAGAWILVSRRAPSA